MSKSHMLFFVYGASGSGKSTLLNMINELSSEISIHRKDTTRKLRPLEKPETNKEIRFKRKLKAEDYVLVYEQFKNQYGIRKDLLTKSFENHKIHFVIIGNIDALKKMKKMYPYAIVLYVHYSPNEIPKHFLERDSLEFKKRKEKIIVQYEDYIKHNTFFDHVILNFWKLETARQQLKNIINIYNKEFEFDILNK